MSDTTDALEHLIASEGWLLLCASAKKEWAERERAGRKQALSDTDDKRSLDKLRQITAAQEAVEWVLALPSEEIARLKRQDMTAEDSSEHRPRSGPPQFVGSMNRRGTL